MDTHEFKVNVHSSMTERDSEAAFVARLACAVMLLLMLAACPLPARSQVAVQGFLDNPAPGSFQSGIGVVAGWHCSATEVSVSFDGGPRTPVAYGTSREDTRSVCGRANTGFGLLFNWNSLGDGPHIVRAFADGERFASATFTVTTLGTEFLRGASGTFTLDNFPEAGRSVTARWQEGVQNFVIVGITGGSPGLQSGWYLGETDQGATCSRQSSCFMSFYIAPTLDKLAPSPLVFPNSPCPNGMTTLAFQATCMLDKPTSELHAVCASLPLTRGHWEFHTLPNTHVVADCEGAACSGTLNVTMYSEEFFGPRSCSTGNVHWTATFTGQR